MSTACQTLMEVKTFKGSISLRSSSLTRKTRPGATLSTPHSMLTPSTHTQHSSLWGQILHNSTGLGECPQQGYSKALANLFHKTPRGERCYQLPQDSSEDMAVLQLRALLQTAPHPGSHLTQRTFFSISSHLHST